MRPSPAKDPLPKALADMREQFRAAAARDVSIEQEVQRRLVRRTRARRFRLRLALGMVLALMLLGGLAVAGGVLDITGPEIEPEPQRQDSSSADPGVVTSSAVPDPDGGPPWALKVFSNDRGEECLVLGRLRRGVLGRVRDGAFRPLPADTPAHCGDLSREPLMAVMEREAGPSRTVVYGVSAGRESVVVTVAGSRTRVRTAALGTFVLVRPGARAGDESGARVSATVDGRQIVVRLD